MSKAFQCDICEALFSKAKKDKYIENFEMVGPVGNQWREWDICPECQASLQSHIDVLSRKASGQVSIQIGVEQGETCETCETILYGENQQPITIIRE